MDRRVTCEHLNRLVDVLDKDLWQSKEVLTCFNCGCPGPNLWICLQPNCRHIGCSEVKNDHSTIHQKNYPSHCVHMNISTERIWCYTCEKEVHIQGALHHKVQCPDSTSLRPPTLKYGFERNFENDDDDDDGLDYSDDPEAQPRGLIGLQNLGNTCYMNAALQALSHTQPLTEYFIDCSSVVCILAGDKKPGLSRAYQKLIKELWSRKTRGYVVPNNILYGIRNVHPMFRGYHQHDTQEFLRCFMDQLHEELKEPVCDAGCEDKLNSEADGDHQEPRSVHVRRRAASSGASDTSYFNSIRRKSPAPSVRSEPRPDGYLRIHNNLENGPQGGPNCHRRSASFAGTQHSYSTHMPLYAGEPSRSQGSESDLSCSSEAEERYETCSSGGASDAPESRHETRHKTSVSCGGSGDCAGSGGLKYRSVISDVFDGKLLSSVQCLICDRVSTRVETFQDLSLPIPSREQLAVLRSQQPILSQHAPGQPGHESWLWWFLSWLRSWFYGPVVSLQDCLAAFFSADELKGDNMYSCSRCNKLRNGVKMSGVVRLPEVLCVHLKRFRHELMFSAKVGARVAFPLQDLNMAPYTHKDCTSKITRYELSAVISHSGTAGGGHYTCVAKNGPGWYEFDDQCVTPISTASVAHIEAYVLFYRKVNPQMAVLRQKAMEIFECATYEPNDIKFYISKQWLNKFNTWAEPGPIDNSDFVCAHGAVRPDRAPHLHELAQRVPQHYWDFMYANFGGGPACTHVHECSGCARAAERLRERRATELRAFYELHAMFQAQEHPRAVYAISMNWFRQWQAFVRDKTPRPPPPVDNTGIVSKQEQESGTVYMLKPGSDHAQLSEELWRFFTGTYGGGPEVMLRRAPAVHAPRYISHSRTSDSDREDHIRSASETNLMRPQTDIPQKNQTLQHVYKTYNDKEEERFNTREQNGNYQDSEEEAIQENGIDGSDHDANDNIVYNRVHGVQGTDVELQNADGVSLKNKKSGRVRKMKRRTVK